MGRIGHHFHLKYCGRSQTMVGVMKAVVMMMNVKMEVVMIMIMVSGSQINNKTGKTDNAIMQS